MNTKDDGFKDLGHSMIVVAIIAAVTIISVTGIVTSALAPKGNDKPPSLQLKIEAKPQ